MKAIIYSKYGGPENLRMEELAIPVPKSGEVLINVIAASVNDWDLSLLQGDVINRLMNGVFKPKKQILGSDVAGRIEAVGEGVSQFKVGDEVYGDLSGRWGGFAEYVCAPETSIMRKPATMSFEQAAAFPHAGMLAIQGLVDNGNMKPGQALLINGAGGGVGTFGLQLAKMNGVEVTGVDHSSKLAMMREMGFDHVIDYEIDDFTRMGKCYDLILDVKTNRSPRHYLRALKPGGRYITVGGHLSRLLQNFLLGPLLTMFSKKSIRIVGLKPNRDLPYINELFEAGQLIPAIPAIFPMNEFREAFRIFEKAVHKGKVVIRMQER